MRETEEVTIAATPDYDVIIVGAGLAGGLLAVRLSERRPDLRLLLLERHSDFSATHTWSYHSGDLAPADREWVLPHFASRSWEGYEVRFPDRQRVLNSQYHSLRSQDFGGMLKARLGNALRMGCAVQAVLPQEVHLESREVLRAEVVIDARGFLPFKEGKAGYQKFVGLDLELCEPHLLSQPLLMDATCSQTDGFRFFYLLPWDERRLLIEDTRYSDSPELDVTQDSNEILLEAARRGFRVKKIERTEVGILPIPFAKDSFGPQSIGTRGGFFHEVTGYSFPYAVRIASALADIPVWTRSSVQEALARETRNNRASSFFLLLNRMLFKAAHPALRYRLLERFYGLNEALIQRFYSGRLRIRDQARILVGKPPVPLRKAIRCLID